MANMSFALTTESMRNYAKTVTRRYGWKNIQPTQILWAVEKGMGLKKGEKIQRIHEIQVLDSRWEPLNRMIKEPAYGEPEVIREGFPEMKPAEFVEMLCDHSKKLPSEEVNRIEFRHLLRTHYAQTKYIPIPLSETFTYPDGTIGGKVHDIANEWYTESLNIEIDQKFRFLLS